ncbi:MAG: cell division protein SepF [Lachnospiraceae bacterium]|nr:cell division protein SepF [Lachnospiraceae bacterium]
MAIFDKLLDSIRVNDDDYDDDEYFDEEDDLEPSPKKSSKRSIRSATLDDDDFDDDVKSSKRSRNFSNNKKNARTTSNGNAVVVVKPTSVDESREITDTLLDNCTVVLNMEGLDMDVAQRIIDFASGSTYAIGGNLQKISNHIFIITPKSVDISGDFQELLSGAFDAPTASALQNRF